MGRSTIHYTDDKTNNILKRLHKKLRPAGTPVQRVEYIIELLLLRIFEIKLRQDKNFEPLRKIFSGDNDKYLFSYLQRLTGEQIKSHLNKEIFPFYAQILSKAKQVFKDNLPQKVLDNLVLIEEVFANSSFTTNVQSGNMSEIIGLISEIDETTILKTDILGDAIESALSETGGTQDIGLYRTPEHIRQLMVAITDPTFDDIIFDPACGTGGFLFDAYHYCIEKIRKDGSWPSPKCPPSHPELNKYFEKYFSNFNVEVPDIDKANKFYREGIGGIEYLGMIRKMAAINLYIRGINPANIIQGDSLQHFNPETDANSKTLILSNPPFGAEKDQQAYPNVWQEYAKESETTILFVKLMFDLLKKGGRCAVIVSEGFLTWDKPSAKAMRKILLDEANLKAIIGLPQGVFVSKQGQGVKTSILYFEKGKPTKWVWYYKIENDGFSMGVNRKPIEGCQIPEVIETFHKYVKHDKIPPETKNSFVIPVEWIKTLDPRLKEKIKKATEEKIIIKRNTKREKLQKQLNEKREKGKLTEDEYNEKLKSFDLITQSKIQNEISKEIEKSYLYSFNFQTYKSDLMEEQIKEWKEVLKDIDPENNINLDTKYTKLKTADVHTALRILASFNPQYALEMDIARDILNKLPAENEKVKKLQEILRKGHRYPRVKLEELLFDLSNERIFYIEDDKIY
jgi:type I restriction-modification system DNA methylase subunit